MTAIEDRSRRNNLRFDNFREGENETPEESEKILRNFIEMKLEIQDKIKIERAHRTGWRKHIDGTRKDRTLIAKSLDYKDKMKNLGKYREDEMWKEKIYINEDFSEMRARKRKILLQQVKELKSKNIKTKVVYNKTVYQKVKVTILI